ncbi:MAG: hypothetical protein ACYTGC_00610 [Planctomycetota bacterium]|jgi:hypothetical protein
MSKRTAVPVAIVACLLLGIGMRTARGKPGGGMWACCFPDGSCSMLSQPVCSTQGGQWSNGLQCFQAQCEVGACCLPTGACEVARLFDCVVLMGGQWLGADTTCEDADQDGTADLCEVCHGDVDEDGVVGVDDLLLVIFEWGDC